MEAVSRPCIWAWRSSCGFFLSTKAFPSLTSSSFPRVLASSHVIKHAQVCRRAPVFSNAHVHRRPAARCLNTLSSSKPSDDAKLTALRLLFEKKGVEIDAYIVPSQDPHQSEFIAECFMRRAFISGFTGSAGTAVVTKDKAALWTDGRYFLQAENQLGLGWLLMRAGNIGVPTVGEWLADILPIGSKVGIDPFLFSFHAAEELKETLSKKSQKLVYLYDFNLVDEIWKESRPSPPNMPVRIHDVKFAGLDASTKLRSLRSNLMEAGAKAIVISMLDEVAWLLNLRGTDVPHSPVFYAYLVVEQDLAVLFIEESKIPADVLSYLVSSGVSVKPYELLTSDITRLAKNGAKLWLDASTINAAIVNAFENGCKEYHGKQEKMDRKKIKGNLKRKEASMQNESGGPTILYRTSPVAIAKAIKNEAELEGLRHAHLRDAAALAEFWSWIERKVVSEKNFLTEVEVSDKLFEFRAKQDGFLDTSFDTICGSGGNGAIIHYHAEPNSCGMVDGNNLLLLDSGGQYVDGTTDVTRTVHFGEPTSREKECFTRVLQGHIALDQAAFPEYTPGFVLDVLARSSLWKIGLDYRHGTGHGVGAALNVHEGPHSISYRYENTTGLQKGMIVSNEPGYYEDRRFGIRIENLLAIQELQTPNRYGGVSFLGFERLTFVPIQTKLLDLSIMSETEITWLNQYHSDVWEKVSSLVDGKALSWLWENTRPISLAKQDCL